MIKQLLDRKIFRIILASVISSIMITLFLIEINSRNFLCFSNGKCVTTWQSGGLIVVPYKYYGLLKPKIYAISLDSGAGAYGASVYLSKNPQYEFVVDAYRARNFSNNKIMTITAENGIEGLSKQQLESNAIRNESYDIGIGTDFTGGGTVIEKWKNGQKKVVVAGYRIFQNDYIPFVIILFTVSIIRFLSSKPILINKPKIEQLKILTFWNFVTIIESIVVAITIVVLVVGTLTLVFGALTLVSWLKI